jgi:hypothetical protein
MIDVAGHSMIMVVTGDHTPKPYPDLTGAIMLTALKLGLDGFELRNQSLLCSDPPDVKVSVLWRCRQKWVKAKKLKVSGFTSPRRFRSRAA